MLSVLTSQCGQVAGNSSVISITNAASFLSSSVKAFELFSSTVASSVAGFEEAEETSSFAESTLETAGSTLSFVVWVACVETTGLSKAGDFGGGDVATVDLVDVEDPNRKDLILDLMRARIAMVQLRNGIECPT